MKWVSRVFIPVRNVSREKRRVRPVCFEMSGANESLANGLEVDSFRSINGKAAEMDSPEFFPGP